MNVRFKRKLYSRGGSYETTIPVQMLFATDISKKNNVIFEYDAKQKKWTVSIEECDSNDLIKNKKKSKKSDRLKK